MRYARYSISFTSRHLKLSDYARIINSRLLLHLECTLYSASIYHGPQLPASIASGISCGYRYVLYPRRCG